MWLGITLFAAAWLLSVLTAYQIGYRQREIIAKIARLEVIHSKVDDVPEPEEPVSTLIDPTDAVQNAIYERDKMMKELNG